MPINRSNTMQAASYTNGLLDAKRQKGDDAVQLFISEWLSDPGQGKIFYAWMRELNRNIDLDLFSGQFASAAFVSSSRTLPAWADRKLMARGSGFFIRRADAIMSLLGLLSLPYCYAAAEGAKVLYLTERLRDRPAKRLLDTAEFVWDVMAPDAFEPEGKGFASCLKIRMTHALARHYVLKNSSWPATAGLPVNQEDMAGTNLAFSLIVVRGLRKLGVAVSYEEQQSFMHLWNVIGFMLGVDEDLLPESGRSATLLESAISQRHFRISLEGRALAKSLLEHITIDPAMRLSPREIYQIMRFLLNDEVADILDIPKMPGVEYAPVLLKLIANLPRLENSNLQIAYRERYLAFMKAKSASGV